MLAIGLGILSGMFIIAAAAAYGAICDLKDGIRKVEREINYLKNDNDWMNK